LTANTAREQMLVKKRCQVSHGARSTPSIKFRKVHQIFTAFFNFRGTLLWMMPPCATIIVY